MSRNLLRFIACFLPFWVHTAVLAQFQVRQISTENGLPSNGIKGMQWDKKTGFLWIATEAGLVRSSGIGFKTFDVVSNPEFGSNRIVTMVKNTAGKILVLGLENNLSLVNNNTVLFNFRGGKLAKNNSNHFNALAASDTLQKKCFKTPWKNELGIVDVSVLPVSDTLCLAMGDGKLFNYSLSTPQPVLVKSVTPIIKTLFSAGNHVYFSDQRNRLYSYNSNTTKYREEILMLGNGEKFVMKDDSRIIWQAGMEFPVMLQEGNAWLLEPDKTNGLRARLIGTDIPKNINFKFAQYVKEGDYLFLGTISKGVYLIQKNQLTVKQPATFDFLVQNSFYSQVELNNGNILTNQGVIIGDNTSRNDYNLGTGFHKNVYFSGDSMLIYSKGNEVFRYNRRTYSNSLLFNANISNNFAVAFSAGRLYFANHEGISVINEKGVPDFLKHFKGIKPDDVEPFDMIEEKPGILLWASCDGLFRFDIKSKSIDTVLKLPNICIRTLHKEGAYVFIGTYGGGYYVLKNNQLKPMPLDINQYLKYAHCFMADDAGFCWISTNNGLLKAKVSDITDAFENDRHEIYYHYLGKDDGMLTTEMNGGCTPCAIRLKNGNFSYPTMDGLIWLNPEKAKIVLPSGEIYFDKLIADGEQEYGIFKDTIHFPMQVNKLDISLVTNAWCKKENLYVDYKLNDGKWLPVDLSSGEPKISFNNLSYGNYVLSARKLNGFGVNNYSYRKFTFIIATPFYHQWWFRMLEIAFSAGLIYLIFKLYFRQVHDREKRLSAMVEEKTIDLSLKNIELEKNDEIKTRLISIINHDIITPLKFMHYASNALVENRETVSTEKKLKTITEISQTAKELELLSSQILNWIIYQHSNERMNSEEFDIRQLVEMIFKVLLIPATQKKITLQNDVPENLIICQYKDPVRVMIYNLILNGLNFSREGIVSVQCHTDINGIIVQVTDYGLGMTTDQIDNLMSDDKIIASANVHSKKGTGLGYMIIKDLLKMTGGSLFIKSNRGTGTVVSISLPEL